MAEGSPGGPKLELRPILELDLDYLEDANYRRRKRVTTPLQEVSPDSVDLVKVVLLGASGVGKTSIIQQFVWNEFGEKYSATEKKYTYYPSVIINERLYELKITDIPVIPFFPVNAYYEWTDYRFYGLRSATAYIFVFDLSNIDTFEYVRTVRGQMMESRDMADVPVVVVGNKQDMVNEGTNEKKKNDIVSLVTKHWKCIYIECSAKFNWKVMQVFKQLMEQIDSSYTLQPHPQQLEELFSDIHEVENQTKCSIL